jgi:hypothetical protein
MFRFDKLSNSSKSVHTAENSQILSVEQKKFFGEPTNDTFELIQWGAQNFWQQFMSFKKKHNVV